MDAMLQHAEKQNTVPKEPDRARSRPTSGDTPPHSGGLAAGVVGTYLRLFGRPPLGDHPSLDGYATGRKLAEEYPAEMQRVMEGFRQGVKEATETAAPAGGQDR